MAPSKRSPNGGSFVAPGQATVRPLSLPVGRDKKMQHTDKYKLDLIEKTDAFSPDPLNQNMEKVEAVLSTLDGRVTVLEARKFATGTRTGQDIQLGFTPAVVFLQYYPKQVYVTSTYTLTAESMLRGGYDDEVVLQIVDGGFYAATPYMSTYDWNNSSYTYYFLALG